jgi:transcription elongation factor SPT6
VHPETYMLAGEMAIAALDLGVMADTSIALEKILKAPEKLKELDLDAYAEELARQVGKWEKDE